MKRAALVAAAIAVALPASSPFPAAFGATLSSTPRHHVRHHRHSVAGPAVEQPSAAHDPKFLGMSATVAPLGMSATVGRPSTGPEWDCTNKDCSWEPYGWRGSAY